MKTQQKTRLLALATIFTASTSAFAQSADTQAPVPTAYPIILSFIASISADDMQEADTVYRKTFKSGGIPFITAPVVNGGSQEDAFVQTITKTGMWVPYVKAAIERKMGAGSVLLDPLLVRRSKNGDIEVQSDIDIKGVNRLYYLSYESIKKDIFGTPFVPSTRGRDISPILVQLQENELSTSPEKYSSFLNEVVKKSGRTPPLVTINKDDFGKVVGSIYKINFKTPVNQIDKLIDKPNVAAIMRLTPSDEFLKSYNMMLGLGLANDPDLKYTRAFWEAELTVRRSRESELLNLLTNSEYAKAIREMALAEDSQEKQTGASMAALSGGISNSLAGGALSGISNIAGTMSTVVGQIAAVSQQQSALALSSNRAVVGAAHEQVRVSSSTIGLDSEVSFGSIAEMREKFKQIFAKAVGRR